MVAWRGLTGFFVDNKSDSWLYIVLCGQFLGEMHCNAVLAFCVKYVDSLTVKVFHYTAVAYLSAHFSIKWGAVEYNLVILLVFLCDFAISQDVCINVGAVISHELLFAFVYNYPVAGLDSGCVAGTRFLRGHLGVESGVVKCHAIFLEDELGKVERESVGVIELECFLAGNLGRTFCAGLFDGVVEQADAIFESAEECILFFLDDTHYEFALFGQFGICLAHTFD